MRRESEKRRGLALLLRMVFAVAVFMSCFFIYRNNSYAVVSVKSTDSGDYETQINGNNIVILRYTGNASGITNPEEIIIPAKLNHNGNEYDVVIESIDYMFFPVSGEDSALKSFSVEEDVKLSSGKYMFYDQYNLQNIDLSKLNTSDAYNMCAMFQDCRGLKSIDLSAFDTEKVEDMGYMFQGCSSLEEIDISTFDTSNVTRMNSMFCGASALKKVKFGNIDTSKVQTMYEMFSGCTGINELDLRKFNTSDVRDMSYMFCGCSNLEKLDLSSFNTSMIGERVDRLYGNYSFSSMLYGCEKLQELKAPASIFDDWSIALPRIMHIKKADGTILPEGFDELTEYHQGETLVFSKNSAILKINEEYSSQEYKGKEIDVAPLFTLAEGAGEATYSLEEETGRGTLSGSKLKVTKAGSFIIKISTKETGEIYAGKAESILNVGKGEGDGKLSIDDVPYGGTPDPKASSTTNPGKVIYRYKLSKADDSKYSATVPTEPGKYTVKAIFESNDLYECSATAEFSILGAIDITGADVTLSSTEFTYDGKEKTPSVTVWIGNKKLVKDIEYTVKYINNVKAGTATVTVSGKGGYTGSKSVQFTIKPDENADNGSGNGSSEGGNGSENGNNGSENNNGNGGENTEDIKTNPYEEYGLSDKYVPDDYEDKSGSPMIIEGKENYTWNNVNEKSYWYEGGIKQGTYYDPHGVLGEDPDTHEATIRGREIYDAASDGWYWLDSCYDGAKAVGKEVWVPYIYQDEAEWDEERMREVAYESDEGMGELVFNFMKEKKGKWVRYDENGRMLKGWVTIEGALADLYPDQAGNTYYYDHRTGLMAKGWVKIDGKDFFFDENTGVLVP